MFTLSFEDRVLGAPSGLGFCECGCGETTQLSDRTSTARRVVRGQPLRYINGHTRRGKRRKRYEPRDCGFESPCWVWQLALNKQTGYGYERDDSGEPCLAHRAVYESLVGPIPAGMQLDHLCRNRACVNPDHLEPVTNAENSRRGAKSKLTWADVEAIRASGLSQLRLGEIYGVHGSHISRIQRGLRWG